jgi:hypothetical protein
MIAHLHNPSFRGSSASFDDSVGQAHYVIGVLDVIVLHGL